MRDELDSPQAAFYAAYWRELVLLAFDELVPSGNADGDTLLVYHIQQMINADHPLWQNEELGTNDRMEILELAMERAWDFMTSIYGDDRAAWSWGEMHGTNFRHSLARISGDDVPALAPALYDIQMMFNRTAPINGGITSVNRQPWNPQNETFDVVGSASSMRMVADLSNPDQSRFILPVGQSGDPRTSHYADQMPLWASGEYVPHGVSAEAVDALTVETWVFLPE